MNEMTEKTYLGQTPKRWAQLLASAVLPALILFLRPLGMTWRQGAVVSALLLTIIWWTTGWVRKIPASIFLLAVFALCGGVPAATVFTFPLSENFWLITLTYLFSQGISNSGLVEKLFEPVLLRFARTPARTLAAIILMYLITIYMIPQPLARLIIVAVLFGSYLSKTTAPEETKSVLMFACFLFYAVVNLATRDADIIMNKASIGFAGLEMTDGQWIQAMAVPTFFYGLLVMVLFLLLFRKSLFGVKLAVKEGDRAPASRKLDRREWATLAVIVGTVALWMTVGVHHINSTLITAVSTVVLFAMRVLAVKDFRAIDVTTLVFLTAAFSIGGVMKACGAADIVFSQVQGLFPAEYSLWYVIVMIGVAMLMHMILGSNTTTLSVVIPGFMILCQGVLPPSIIMFIAFLSVAFHSILPFHSVAMMIGVSNNYFPAKYVTKFGIPATLLVFVGILCCFIPWWTLIGLL